MSDRRTASYVAVPAIDDVGRYLMRAVQRPSPPRCRCADPQAVIVSTGPVLCSTCGRRIGDP